MKPMTIIRKAVLLLLFSLIIPTSAGVYISIKEVTDPMTIYFINGSAMMAGSLFLLFIIQKSRFHLKEIGCRKGALGMWVIPILIIEAIPFIAGLNTDLSLSSFTALCFFMVCVGIFEEGIFRGILLIFKANQSKHRHMGFRRTIQSWSCCESFKWKKPHLNRCSNPIRLLIWIRCS